MLKAVAAGAALTLPFARTAAAAAQRASGCGVTVNAATCRTACEATVRAHLVHDSDACQSLASIVGGQIAWHTGLSLGVLGAILGGPAGTAAERALGGGCLDR